MTVACPCAFDDHRRLSLPRLGLCRERKLFNLFLLGFGVESIYFHGQGC